MAEATNEAVLGAQESLSKGSAPGRVCSDGLTRSSSSKSDGTGGGCRIANLVAELGERDDDIRNVLASGFDRWQASIRAGLGAMVVSGELRPDADLDWLSGSILASVQGGLMLTQARRDPGSSAKLSMAHSL